MLVWNISFKYSILYLLSTNLMSYSIALEVLKTVWYGFVKVHVFS